MKIEIQRNETSEPLVYESALNAYTKGPMYCVLFEREGRRVTHKFPLCGLFRVVETPSATIAAAAVVAKIVEKANGQDKLYGSVVLHKGEWRAILSALEQAERAQKP